MPGQWDDDQRSIKRFRIATKETPLTDQFFNLIFGRSENGTSENFVELIIGRGKIELHCHTWEFDWEPPNLTIFARSMVLDIRNITRISRHLKDAQAAAFKHADSCARYGRNVDGRNSKPNKAIRSPN